jgi:hypothetical protein
MFTSRRSGGIENVSGSSGAVTTVSGMDEVAVAVPAVPVIGMATLPAAMALDVEKKRFTPALGTLIGKVEEVVTPAGSAPRLTVGVAVVPVSTAVIVTKKERPGATVTLDGTPSVRVG